MKKVIVPLFAGLVLTGLFALIELLQGYLGFPIYIMFLICSITRQENVLINLMVTYAYLTLFAFAFYYVRKTQYRYVYWVLIVVLFFVLNTVGIKLTGLEDIIKDLLFHF